MPAIDDIAAERRRQIESEGWSREHDDQHADGSLADVAACYAATKMPTRQEEESFDSSGGRGDCPVWSSRYIQIPRLWPKSWSFDWWKPKDRRRNLVRAGALIVAEIERLDRASLAKSNAA